MCSEEFLISKLERYFDGDKQNPPRLSDKELMLCLNALNLVVAESKNSGKAIDWSYFI